MKRIAQLRKERGWSQMRLATEAGLHVQTVSEAERGYRGDPAPQTLEAIARAFEVPVTDLLAEPEPEVAATP